MSVVLARTGLLDCQASSGAILSALPSATAGSAYCLATLTDVEPTSSSRNFQAPVAPINGIDGPRTPADELPPAANRIISNSVADRALFLTLGGLFVVRPPRQGQTVSALSAAKPPASALKVFPAQFDTAPPLDAKWHPLSDSHFVVLSKDGIRAFDATTDCSRPCDEWLFPEDLTTQGAVSSHSFSSSSASSAPAPSQRRPFDPIAFSFGSARGWELLTLFILSTDGSLYALTPFLPHGLLLPSADWLELLRSTTNELNQAIAAAESSSGSSSLFSPSGRRTRLLGNGGNNEDGGSGTSAGNGSNSSNSSSSSGGLDAAKRRQALELSYQWLKTCFVDAGVAGEDQQAAAVEGDMNSSRGEAALWKRYFPPPPASVSSASSSSLALMRATVEGQDGSSISGPVFARAGPVPADLLARLLQHSHYSSSSYYYSSSSPSASLSAEMVSDFLGRPWAPALQGPIAVAPEIHQTAAGGGGDIASSSFSPACDLLVLPANSAGEFSMLAVLFADGRVCLIGAAAAAASALQPSWGQAYWPVASMGPALPAAACAHVHQQQHRQHQYQHQTQHRKHTTLSSAATSSIVSATSSSASAMVWLVLEAVDLRLGGPLQVARAALDSGRGTFVGASKASNGLKVHGQPQLLSMATDIRTGNTSSGINGIGSSSVDGGAVVDVVQVPWLLPLPSSSAYSSSSSFALSAFDGDGSPGSSPSDRSACGFFVVSRHAVHLVRFGGLHEMKTLLQRTVTTSTAAAGGTTTALEKLAALARSKTACIEVTTTTTGGGGGGGGNLDIAGACVHPRSISHRNTSAATTTGGEDERLAGGPSLRIWALPEGSADDGLAIDGSSSNSNAAASLPGQLLSFSLLSLTEQAAAMSASLSASSLPSGSSNGPAAAVGGASTASSLSKLPPFAQVMRSAEMVEALERPFNAPSAPTSAAADKDKSNNNNASAVALAALKTLSEASTAAVNHALKLHRAQATMQARSAVLYSAAEGNIALAEKVASTLNGLQQQASDTAFLFEKAQAKNIALMEAARNILATLAMQQRLAQQQQRQSGSGNQEDDDGDDAAIFKRRIDAYSSELARSLKPKVERLKAQLEGIKKQRDALLRKRARIEARKAQGLSEEEAEAELEDQLQEEEEEEAEELRRRSSGTNGAPSTPQRGQHQPKTTLTPLVTSAAAAGAAASSSRLGDLPPVVMLEVQQSVDAAIRGVTQAKRDHLEVLATLQMTEDEVHERLNAVKQGVTASHYSRLAAQAAEERREATMVMAAASSPEGHSAASPMAAAAAAVFSPPPSVIASHNSLFASFASIGTGSSPAPPRTPVNHHY